MSAGGARDALRAATDAAHRRLHDLPDFRALAEGRITRAAYAALLRRKLGFHAALEARLAAVPGLVALGVDVAARCRAPLIRDDLRWLGEADAAPLAPLPSFEGAPDALGALYVAEGSTLGGRHLARALDPLLPPGVHGRRFLLGHGERHGALWRACCDAIERCGAEPADLARMIGGAVATFAAFEDWFSSPPAPAGEAGWRPAARRHLILEPPS
jgi:heme oxygenase